MLFGMTQLHISANVSLTKITFSCIFPASVGTHICLALWTRPQYDEELDRDFYSQDLTVRLWSQTKYGIKTVIQERVRVK